LTAAHTPLTPHPHPTPLRFLVQHKLVDVLVTTAGGIEEDFIKCMAPTYMGDFAHKGIELRKQVGRGALRCEGAPMPGAASNDTA
jgi:hypothetical protein